MSLNGLEELIESNKEVSLKKHALIIVLVVQVEFKGIPKEARAS